PPGPRRTRMSGFSTVVPAAMSASNCGASKWLSISARSPTFSTRRRRYRRWRSFPSKPANPACNRPDGLTLRPARGGVGVVGGREAAGAHVLGILASGGGDIFAELAVAADEFRREVGEKAEHVIGHQDLAVARRRATDADRRDRHPLGQF